MPHAPVAPRGKSKDRIGFRLPPDVKEELQVFANEENRSLSNLVKDWIYDELERRTSRTFSSRKTRRG